MLRTLGQALRLLLLLTLLTGVLYPLAVTAIGSMMSAEEAHGSLILRDGVVVGSALIGQANQDPAFFWPRPSATGYSALPSSGGNLGMTSAALRTQVEERAAALRAAHQFGPDQEVPPEMIHASGSGLDPHISPAAALLQAQRVAAARGLPVESVAALVARMVEGPQFGLLGDARVNVLHLNLALEEMDKE